MNIFVATKKAKSAEGKAKPEEQQPSQICDTIGTWAIFDAIDSENRSLIANWIVKEKIGKREIGQLDQKVDMLEKNGPNLPPSLLAGPIKSKRKPGMVSHIYKLRMNGDRALRPFLCKGPIDMEREYTMLIGAIEINRVLNTDSEDAEKIRSNIIKNPKLRKKHERYF